jgi:hypothetical protein
VIVVYDGSEATHHPQLGLLVPGVEMAIPPHLEEAASLAVAGGLVRVIESKSKLPKKPPAVPGGAITDMREE